MKTTFPNRLKMLRLDQGFSQNKLAQKLEKAESTIRMWELGKNQPDYDTLIRIAEFFNCSLDYLLGMSDDKNTEEKYALEETARELCDKIKKIEKGNAYLQDLVKLIDIANERSAPILATGFLTTTSQLKFALDNIYKLYDEFSTTQSFDLSKLFNSCTLLLGASNLAKNNMHIITIYPLAFFIDLAEQYGEPQDAEAVENFFTAYGEVSSKGRDINEALYEPLEKI